MRFSHDLAKRIQQGRKTETRRVAKWIKVDPNAVPKLSKRTRRSPRSHQKVEYVTQSYAGQKVLAPCRYRLEHDYALQVPPDKDSAARSKTLGGLRLLVRSVHLEELGQIDQAGAVAEGFASPSHFRAYWEKLHGSYDPRLLVWVIRFKAVSDPEGYRDLDRLLAQEGRGEHGATHLPGDALRDPETNLPEVRPPAGWESDHAAGKGRDFDLARLMRFEQALNELEDAARPLRALIAAHQISEIVKADAAAKLRALERKIRTARARVAMFDKHVA